MGQRMRDEPIDYGNDCLSCFDAGETPEFVYIRFGLVAICPGVLDPNCITPPNGRVFKLAQVPGFPCQYKYDTDPWHVFWNFKVGGQPLSAIQLRDWSDAIYFAATPASCLAEGTVIHNDVAGCILHDCVYGGIAVVTWTPQATDILTAINITKGDDLFMELFPLADGKLVYKFCRIAESTNIKILYEPD